jgi:hypothetical protein
MALHLIEKSILEINEALPTWTPVYQFVHNIEEVISEDIFNVVLTVRRDTSVQNEPTGCNIYFQFTVVPPYPPVIRSKTYRG